MLSATETVGSIEARFFQDDEMMNAMNALESVVQQNADDGMKEEREMKSFQELALWIKLVAPKRGHISGWSGASCPMIGSRW
jgi:hypothetical protein